MKRWVAARMAATLCAVLACCAGCSHAGGLGVGAHAFGAVGYVDLDAVVAAHPLHAQLQSMQDQIDLLQQESALVPTGMTSQQTAAYSALQAALSAAETSYENDLAGRRAYYEQREAAAISQLQATTLGTDSSAGGVLGGLQQQYGSQARAMQQQALTTLSAYRTLLFKADAGHLRSVQQQLATDLRLALSQRASQLAAAETKFSVDVVKADQEQKLNLQTQLQDLALSAAQRTQYSAQLRALEEAEQSKIDALKARDNVELDAYTKQLQARASARYDAERKATQAATQAKLVARQKEMETQMQPQLNALNGKFQSQLAAANQKLAGNSKYQAQALSIHNQMQSSYVAQAQKATAAYQAARGVLVARYSAIAHMQFQDNAALSAQADQVAAQRRDLYQKIVAQVQAQVADIAQASGVGIVLTDVRGSGSAIDLTARVSKAISELTTATPTPAASGSGGP